MVPTTKQVGILQGLNEFIMEFMEDSTQPDKINFQRALVLLQEIGSPTEIILTLDASKARELPSIGSTSASESSSRICNECYQSNPTDAIYCENCGYNLYAKRRLKATVSQKIVDHPYSASFLALYGILVVLVSYWEGFVVTSHHQPLNILAISLINALFPSILLALLVGLVTDFFLKDRKSFTYRYNKVINHFENNFALGLVMVFFSSLILVMAGLSGLYGYILLGIGIFLVALVSIPFGLVNKPQDLPYVTLLRAKQRFDHYILDKLRVRNVYPGIVLFILTLLWGMVIYRFFVPKLNFEGELFITFLLLIALGLGYNGYLLMYYYSWPKITKFIRQHLGG